MIDLLPTVDPIRLAKELWPDVVFYKEQRQIIYSVWYNDETIVAAGNKLGKDFVAAYIVLAFFLTRNPCKIVTTSVKEKHLNVLWGEIAKFIRTCKYPLDHKKGGPLVINADGMKKVIDGEVYPDSYVMRLVANQESMESFQGHHATPDPGMLALDVPLNLFVSDESSGMPDDYYKMAITWAKRILLFGNPWPCENYFKHAVKGGRPGTNDIGGDLPRVSGIGLHRKVFRLRAEDSPNVRLALAEVKAGRQPSGRILCPGVKPYSEYLENRRNWDEIQQMVSLDALFPEGKNVKFFPDAWLDRAANLSIPPGIRVAKGIGIDSAEGGDNTCMTASDAKGLIALESRKTPDTAVISGDTLAFMRKHKADPESVMFDAGGGGKEHADYIRRMGFKVRTVRFGQSATAELQQAMKSFRQRKEEEETRYVFKNRRAEMYWALRQLLDPSYNAKGWHIPKEILDRPRQDGGPTLRQQMAAIPLWYDEEGRIFLPPKKKRPDLVRETDKKSLTEMLGGFSPDELDSLVLSVWGMVHKPHRATAGVM